MLKGSQLEQRIRECCIGQRVGTQVGEIDASKIIGDITQDGRVLPSFLTANQLDEGLDQET